MIDLDYYVKKLQKKKFSIFLFHGVIKESVNGIRNYTKKHILEEDFENLMINLKRYGIPLALDEVVQFHKKNMPLPDFSFSITFDDGFENNYSIARPILEKLSIPATFYVSTNLIDKNLMTWIDQIEYCIDQINSKTLDLPWSNVPFKISSKKTKIKFLNYLRQILKKDPVIYPSEKLVRYIFQQCGINLIRSSDGPLDKKMNWKQISNLHNNKLFSVGGHSHNHVSLGLLEPEEMKSEIQKSINYLKNKGDIESQHYSYPEGQDIDYNKNVEKLLKISGIKCCPTAIDGQNNNILNNLFNLKRVMVV
tara:strand:- start:9445 stop:10368 length:924 start_codon:yes stop_codon:yes gene_type:complete